MMAQVFQCDRCHALQTPEYGRHVATVRLTHDEGETDKDMQLELCPTCELQVRACLTAGTQREAP